MARKIPDFVEIQLIGSLLGELIGGAYWGSLLGQLIGEDFWRASETLTELNSVCKVPHAT